MAEVSQLAETETSCDVSIEIQDERTSMEQRTMPKQTIPFQLAAGMAEVSQSAETETGCHVSVATQKALKGKKQKPTLPSTMSKQKIPMELMSQMGWAKDYLFAKTAIATEQRTMRRVPPHLLEVNKKAYEPYVISFGPYHRGKEHLYEMEGRKEKSLNKLLQRTNPSDEKYLSSAIAKMVEEAQNCYSELSEKEFVELMVLDGCFIIQLIMGTLEDLFCTTGLIYTSILRDLVLVENQIPFFVLCELLDTIPKTFFNLEGSTDPKGKFISQLLERFEDKMPGLRVDRTDDDDSMKNVKHIVHLLHSNWLPSDNAIAEYKKHPKDGKWRFIRPATELREAGIEFKMAETEGNEKQSLFDIKFEKGKGMLEMPKLTIEDDTESLYRNLIACEQFDNKPPLYLLDYVALMNCLINSGKDVELLCQSKIIDNLLGDDESVAALFNKLGDHANISRKDFFYAQLFNDINEHYYKTWNKWKADLRQKYFNTPWAFISFLAATLLILLTVLQTTFTIFPRS